MGDGTEGRWGREGGNERGGLGDGLMTPTETPLKCPPSFHIHSHNTRPAATPFVGLEAEGLTEVPEARRGKAECQNDVTVGGGGLPFPS